MNNILKMFHGYPHSSNHSNGGVVERVLLQVEQIMFMVCLNTTVTRDAWRGKDSSYYFKLRKYITQIIYCVLVL